jgi:hypothetical protein
MVNIITKMRQTLESCQSMAHELEATQTMGALRALTPTGNSVSIA